MSEEYISLKPSDAHHGGGLPAEGDYDIVDAKFGPWDYGGTIATAVAALAVEFKSEDQSAVQWYSAGDMRNLRPSEDGKRLVKVGSSTGLNDGTNCYQFMTALVRAGLSEDKIGSDISILIGMRISLVHEATQERDIKGQKKKAGIMAVVGKILSFPGEKEKAKGKGAAAAKKANGQEVSLAPKTTACIVDVLKAAEGKMLEKKALTTEMFRKIPATDTDRSNMLNLAVQDSFLSELVEVGVLYDATKGQVMYVGN